MPHWLQWVVFAVCVLVVVCSPYLVGKFYDWFYEDDGNLPDD